MPVLGGDFEGGDGPFDVQLAGTFLVTALLGLAIVMLALAYGSNGNAGERQCG